ncbi:MAG: glycosyltransferase family 2 protein [Acidobacteriaceae bacterium]|nr:glycosyltransferase family 2 protein [Acidobacteriaceae bacterium]MBV8569543.1 glycosyltransferase family 2 protein [Acidobacteriaceae bacterium]
MAAVTAIIPTWNRADLLDSILNNLSTQSRPPDRITVVDNGSADDTQLVARNHGADLIVFPENRGFAEAVNEGIRRADTDWVLILNNDVVLEPEWLSRLLATAEETGAEFAAGKLLQMRDQRRLDGSWDLVSRAAYAWRCGYGRPDGAIWSLRRKIHFAPMTAALFRRSIFDRIGLLETRFESYYEDIDFGVRCALAGIEGVYEPAAVAIHMDKASLGRRGARVYYLSTRNQLLLLAKHYSPATLRRFAWPVFVGQLLSVFAATRQGHPIAALRGKLDAMRRWSEFRALQQANSRDVTDQAAASVIENAFYRSESEIRRLQQEIGFDIYWRLYFSFVR